MARFLVTADIHANKTRLPKVLQFFEKCKTIIKDKKIDYFVIAGDLWNAMVSNSRASGFVDVISQINDITKLCNVIAIYGTSTHEISGSLDCLIPLGVKVVEHNTIIEENGIRMLCIPEPRRSNYIKPTAQEITNAMNEDLNKAFDNKADLVFFHGEVSGSVLQNGVSAKSDVQVTQEMFDRCGAKLMLCGHIHNPQVIGKNIHYVGSPIPCTFAEQHIPSVVAFSFNNNRVENFERIELGFPQNKLMDIDDLKLFRKLDKFNFANECVKIRLQLTPEEKITFNPREEARKLQEATSAAEIVINVQVKKEVSIRTKEIASATTAVDKLKIYAKVNEIELTDSILGKAKDIEDNLLIKYQFPTHSLELLSLDLKGVKGIKNHESINIDFSKYDDGVIALIGENGAGKTTLIELASPFPKMLTRSGALRQYFYLKDSHRIVTYKDENNRYYKFSTYLAAHTDNGLVEYFAEFSDDEGNTWQKFSGIDGKLDSYKQVVSEIVGDTSVYLRTAFFTKGKVKGINDIATAGKTERLELFSQLLGIDNLSTMHDMVKTELKGIADKMKSMENIEERFEEVQSSVKNKKKQEEALQSQLDDIIEELTDIEKEISETKVKQDEYNKNFAKYGDAIALKSETEDRIAEITEHLDKLKEHKVKNDYYINHTKQIDEYKEVYSTLKPLEEEYAKVSKKFYEYSNDLVEANKNYNEAKSRRDIEQNKYDKTDDRIKSAEDSIVNIEDFCPTCGAKLSAAKKKQLLKAQSYQLSEIESLKQFKETQKNILADAKKAYTESKKVLDKAEKNKQSYQTKFNEIDEKLQSTKAYLDINDLSDFVDYVPVSNLESDIQRFSEELERKMEFLKNFEGVELKDYSAILEDLESKRKNNEGFRLKLSVDIASVQTEIKQLNEQYESMKEQADSMKALSKDYEEYSILEQAFSNSGIQALELEAAAPEIELLTNQILLEGYGDKFSVSIKTLKDSRKKIIDDCEIMVTNHETGWTIPLEELSEGEKVWISQSLYLAFSNIRSSSTGFSFRVRFADEADGALDSEARPKYVNMIKSAHNSGSSRLTVLITHSQEVKDMVSQSIQL